MSVDHGAKTSFESLSSAEKANLIIEERTPKPELVIYEPTVAFLDIDGELTREERAKVIAMGDRTAVSYANLAETVKRERGKQVVVEGETMSSSSAFFMQYALAARSSKEVSHASILEQLEPGPTEMGGNPPIILEGVSVLAGLKEVCSLRHFGFEALSSRGAIFPEKYYRIPFELENEVIGSELKKKMELIDENYRLLTGKLLTHYINTTPRSQDEKLWQFKWRVLNMALDDSRQVTNNAYLTHIAVHPNSALALRDGVVELSASDLSEVHDIANKLREVGSAGLPTIMRHTEVKVFDSDLHEKRLKISKILENSEVHSLRGQVNTSKLLNLNIMNPNPDREFLAAFLGEGSERGLVKVSDLNHLDDAQVALAIKDIFSEMTIHDKPPKALEKIQVDLSILWNTGALYEAIRHRPVLHTVIALTIDNGFTMPAIFKKLGLDTRYRDTIRLSEECYELVEGMGNKYKHLKAYFVTRAHLIEHQMKLSGLDIFHFLKLRAGPGAHADIAAPSNEIVMRLQGTGFEIFNHLQLKN